MVMGKLPELSELFLKDRLRKLNVVEISRKNRELLEKFQFLVSFCRLALRIKNRIHKAQNIEKILVQAFRVRFKDFLHSVIYFCKNRRRRRKRSESLVRLFQFEIIFYCGCSRKNYVLNALFQVAQRCQIHLLLSPLTRFL